LETWVSLGCSRSESCCTCNGGVKGTGRKIKLFDFSVGADGETGEKAMLGREWTRKEKRKVGKARGGKEM
jgi:hypothetical protein